MADLAASSSSALRVKKKSKGQQRLPMKKIEKKTNLLVTFCKRRVGLFKKASELCILCGVQIAIVLFSPAKKAYTFGHPSVDSVMDHFLDGHSHSTVNFIQEGNIGTIERLCVELDELKDQVKMGEKCGQMVERVGNENNSKSWWKKPIDKMNLSELLECKKDVEQLAAAVPVYKARASADPSVSLDLTL